MKMTLEKILQGERLTINEAEAAMDIICSTRVFSEQIAAFLSALRMRGESQDELIGFISSLRKKSLPIDVGTMTVIDTCGTGGDYSNSFNISTAAALLLASYGVNVAKWGGRAVSGQTGSADVLQMLGIGTQTDEVSAVRGLRKHGFIFLLAPQFNSAFSKVKELRQRLGIRTCFNVLLFIKSSQSETTSTGCL